MANIHEATIKSLNDLVEINKDGEEGFRLAAEAIKDPELQTLFTIRSQQRARFAAELQQETMRLGGVPEDSGSVAGALHRGWINIKKVVTGGDRQVIIAECERGEDAAVKAYREALQKPMPPSTSEIVQRQTAEVLESHDEIRALEQTRRAA